MKSRSLKATMLIIALGTVGLGLLLSPLIHDANTTTSGPCDSYKNVAESLCNTYGEGNQICEIAWMYYYVCLCLVYYCN